jgi:hypothetical protein
MACVTCCWLGIACTSSKPDGTEPLATPASPAPAVSHPDPPAPEAEATSGADDEEAAPPSGAQARVETTARGCSEPTRSASGETTVRARRSGKDLRIDVRGFDWYCSPTPAFLGRRQAETLVLETTPPEPPVARCTCKHDVVVTAHEIADDTRRVRLLDREGEEIAWVDIDS